MSDESRETKALKALTEDQVVVLYESALNRTIFVHLSIMLLGAGAAAAFFFWVKTTWLMLVLVMASILASGMVQRLLVIRVRCPACGARVLGHIHSIIQARSVRRCPGCDAKLRS